MPETRGPYTVPGEGELGGWDNMAMSGHGYGAADPNVRELAPDTPEDDGKPLPPRSKQRMIAAPVGEVWTAQDRADVAAARDALTALLARHPA